MNKQELLEAYPEAERLWTAPMADAHTTTQVRQVQRDSPLRPMPLVVLSHGIPFAAPFSGWPTDSTVLWEARLLDPEQPFTTYIDAMGTPVP